MKKLSLAILSTLAFTLASTNVFAVDGTITVNGVVTDQTCILQSGGSLVSGLKDITVKLPTMPKSMYQFATVPMVLNLRNATGTANCDAATNKAFKGIHLSAISPDHLDTADKTLLVNQAEGASKENPVFVYIYRTHPTEFVDFSASWGSQARSPVYTEGGGVYLSYVIGMFSKTRIVDAQNYTAKINYTIHYN